MTPATRRCLVVRKEELVDAVVAEGVSDMLKAMGHSVERVNSGEEALSHVSVNRFDLVLIDGQDRLELARAVKDAAPSTRVILMTGNAWLLEANGVDAILHKPFSDDELVEAVSSSG